MIFLLNKKERKEIDKLIETKYYNDEIASFLNEQVLTNKFQKSFLENVDIISLDKQIYENDYYYKTVTPKEINIGNYQITYDKYESNEIFLYDDLDIKPDDYYLIEYYVGYFKSSFRYLAIKKNNVTWMSVIPHEINTMKKAMNIENENVYVLGLGLGYYPFYMSRKNKKIIIIENDKTIIELFKKYLFPYFPNKEKYEIIEADAFEYLKKLDKNAYIFIDLWHDYKDGMHMYIKLRKMLKNYTRINFWLENNLLASIRHMIINLIEEELYYPNKFNYLEAKDENDILMNKLHQYFLDTKITAYNQLKNILSNNNIKKIIENI